MNPVHATTDEHDPDRYAARFAHQAWLGLTQVASGAGAVVSFKLDTDADGGVHAAASLRGGDREVRYAMTLDPSPAGPPVDIATALFVTAVEERLLSPGFKNPAGQLAIAAARVAQRRRATGATGATGQAGRPDAALASALTSQASLLARQGDVERAIPLLDEAIGYYTELAGTGPDQFRADLERAVALRRQWQAGSLTLAVKVLAAASYSIRDS